MRTLTSAKNPLLKDVRKAVSRGSLTTDGLCVAEGFHLLDEAIRSRVGISEVLCSDSAAESVEKRGIPFTLLPDSLFREIISTEATQGVVALVQPPSWELADLLKPSPALLLILDGVQDPGNAGAILRAAEAFGATGVCFAKGSVSPYNPKALRGSAGSVFRIPLVTGLAAEQIVENLPGLPIFAAMPGTSTPLQDALLKQPCAFALGSEGRGVSAVFLDRAQPITIPTLSVESLNVAMAAAILVYEARRQRT